MSGVPSRGNDGAAEDQQRHQEERALQEKPRHIQSARQPPNSSTETALTAWIARPV